MLRRLYILLLVLILASASWAAFGAVGGGAVCTLLLALVVCVRAGKSRYSWLLRAAAAVLGVAAVFCGLLPTVKAARDTARCMHCGNNLKQIGLALRNYWDVYGSFPPPSTYDESERPMHSWRLLIHPFLDCSATYDHYHLDEPWNSPSNRRLQDDWQYVYKCPADLTAWKPDSAATSYVAVVGRRAYWRWNGPEDPESRSSREESPDVFLVVEMANSGIGWTEPKDVRFDDVETLRSLAAERPHTRGNGYFFHRTPAMNAVLVHGDMVFMFPWDSASDFLTGLLPPEVPDTTTEHGPKYDPTSQLYTETVRVHWLHCIGLPIWIVAVCLLVLQVRIRIRR